MNERKKILFFLKLPPPIHGSTLMNQKVFESALLKESFECRFIGLSLSKNLNEIGHKYLFKTFKVILVFFSLLKTLLKFKPDLVYFTISPKGAAFYKDLIFVLLVKAMRVPIVFHLRGKDMGKASEQNRLVAWLYRWTFKHAFAICLSELLIRDIEPFYSKQPFVLPNGIEDLTTNNIVARKSDVPVVLYLSNLIRTKGILDLIDAMSIIHQHGTKFYLDVVGGPIDLSIEYLHEYANQKNLHDSIRIHGPLYGDQKIQKLMSADIFVFPTYYAKECFPLNLIEAMQFHLPVISTFEGAIPDMIEDAVSGYVVKQQNIQELSERIEHLLIHESLRLSMGKAGRKRFDERYTLQRFESGLIKILNTIIEKNDG